MGELPLYTYRGGPDGPGYYRHAGAPPASDPQEHSLCVLRQAAAAGAGFVRCQEDVGPVPGYDFDQGEEGAGYYRRADAPPPCCESRSTPTSRLIAATSLKKAQTLRFSP